MKAKSVTTEVTICQGQFKPNAYEKNWKHIVFKLVCLQAGLIPSFNEQNASYQFYPRNIEETVARMHKSGILGELQEQYGKKKTNPAQTKHLDSSEMQQKNNNQECFQQLLCVTPRCTSTRI